MSRAAAYLAFPVSGCAEPIFAKPGITRRTCSRIAALAQRAIAFLVAVLLGACSASSDCTSNFRGGCVAGPAPVASVAPAVTPTPVPTPAPTPAPVTRPAVPLGDPATFAAVDDKQCRSYGLKFGTHDYADCRIRLSAQHRGLDPGIGTSRDQK